MGSKGPYLLPGEILIPGCNRPLQSQAVNWATAGLLAGPWRAGGHFQRPSADGTLKAADGGQCPVHMKHRSVLHSNFTEVPVLSGGFDTDQSRSVYLVRLISIWYCNWLMLFLTLDMPDEGTR